jgi:hypothetical protein
MRIVHEGTEGGTAEALLPARGLKVFLRRADAAGINSDRKYSY